MQIKTAESVYELKLVGWEFRLEKTEDSRPGGNPTFPKGEILTGDRIHKIEIGQPIILINGVEIVFETDKVLSFSGSYK